MCRNQEILPVSASLFLRYLLFSNLLRLWDTLQLSPRRRDLGRRGHCRGTTWLRLRVHRLHGLHDDGGRRIP
ncbi:MAG: hypothetical protein J6386_00840 [Candidatus Synoicihabitans palmerolidicus]|nr:hypothetical protein [Candidatus Synoicihabitans palmerolidicus]